MSRCRKNHGFNLTVLFSLTKNKISSHADKAVARALAPRYPFGLVASPHPPKLNLPDSTSLEAEKASLGIHPKQHELKCKRATPAPFHTGASSTRYRSESSKELLKSLALPDQRSSTDLNPITAPWAPQRHWEEPAPLDAALRASRLVPGLPPPSGGMPRCTWQKYLKIQEESSPTVHSVQSHISLLWEWLEAACGLSIAMMSVRRPAALRSA